MGVIPGQVKRTDTIASHPEIERLKSAISELTVLNDLALAAGSTPETDRILDIIVEKAIKAIRAEQGSIMLATPSPEKPLQTLIRQADQSGSIPGYKISNHVTGWVLKYGKPLLITDLSGDARFRVSPDEARLIHTVLAVPIRIAGELIGVMMLVNKKTGREFSTDDLRLATILAAQSGQLIRNSRLQTEAMEKKRLEYQLDLARDMQLKLLPDTVPYTGRIDIARYFRAHESVSGDYYDFFRRPDDRVALVVADVSGHGPSAALVMTLLKGVTYAVIPGVDSPSKALEHINTIISGIIPPDIFVTMLFVEADPSQNSLRYASAGHNPFIYHDGSHGHPRVVESTGCALNVLPEVSFQERTLQFRQGDVLVAFTDGLTEAVNADGEMFGIQRVIEIIENNKNAQASEMTTSICEHLEKFRDLVEPEDDILIISVRHKVNQ